MNKPAIGGLRVTFFTDLGVANMTEGKEKDMWDKMVPLSTLLASVLIPVGLAVIGNLYTSAIKQSENRVKYTELANEYSEREAKCRYRRVARVGSGDGGPIFRRSNE